MATLPTSNYLGSAAGNILGTSGSNTSNAAATTFQYGQYQPYSVNNPLGQTSFSNGTATSSMSPLQSQLSGLFGNQINSNLSGASSSYDPNTSFLPSQYQSIFGNMQGNVSSMFNSLQQAQQPYTQQYLQSNLDNEQSKGTLASTAGAYQTAGAQTAANSQMNSNMAQAQSYALQNAQSQFSAANSTAQLGETQSEFAPQFAQTQTQGLYSNLLNSASLLNQQTSLGGSLGALQSQANTSALQNNFTASQQQDQAQSGLLNGLLTGNGTGGLLNALLGTPGGGSSASGVAGSGLSGFLSGLMGNNVNSPTQVGNNSMQGETAANNYGMGSIGSVNVGDLNDYGDLSSTSTNLGNDSEEQMSNDDLLEELGFSGAGGQAANLTGIPSLANIGSSGLSSSELSSLYGGNTNPFAAAGSAINLGTSIAGGSGLGAAGAATGLAGALGVSPSVTNPLSEGVSAVGAGVDFASGNYVGGLANLLGLGSKAGAIPGYVSQPLSLALSALSGNPIGMALGAYNTGKGLLNVLQGNNWQGQTPDQQLPGQASADVDTALNTAIAPTVAQLSQSNPTKAPSALLQSAAANNASNAQDADMWINSGSYGGSLTNVMNQGEAETPVATLTPQAAEQNALQQAISQATPGSAMQQQLQQQLESLYG